MRKALIFITVSIVLILSSCTRSQYRIHGRVTSGDLEGVQIFLVPLGHEDAEHVDSVYIHNYEFSFKGDTQWMCDIRLDKRHRDKGQNLLVVTEPGDIYVTIGPDSVGGGTPQNDSLQVWKDLTIRQNRLSAELRRNGLDAQADSTFAIYKARTQAMAVATGAESTLGAFLLGLYPLPNE
ncbi:protein of unknown function [Bacteroidales bacterium WCE2004]|nr:protein of unknown function [Bacteroidales bacterium WCE2004]